MAARIRVPATTWTGPIPATTQSARSRPIQLGFEGLIDTLPPRIEGIGLLDLDGQPLTRRAGNRLLVPRESPEVHVVSAFGEGVRQGPR